MDTANRNYIDSLEIKDIPWGRMVTAYCTAIKYPEYFAAMENFGNDEAFEEAFNGISDFEHQETMFPPAPFALIFLVRIFEKALKENSFFVAKEMMDFFENCLYACNGVEKYENYGFLENFSDMLDDRFLLDEEFAETEPDDDELEEIFDETAEIFVDEYFFSMYHYSKEVLSQIPEILGKYGKFPEIKEKFEKMLS